MYETDFSKALGGWPRFFMLLLFMSLVALPLMGQQYFTDESSQRLPNRSDLSNRILLVDVDGDGDLDIVVSNTGLPGALDRLNINDGTGHFQDETAERLPVLMDQTYSIIPGDFDGDGDCDLFVCNISPTNALLINDGSGVFTDETASRLPDVTGARTALVGDLDTDGDLDVVTISHSDASLLLNDGCGFFTESTQGQLPPIEQEAREGLLEDLDKDGDLDIVVVFEISPGVILGNEGNAFFQMAGNLPASADTMKSRGLCTADVDQDLDLDIVQATFSRGFFGDRIFINNNDLLFLDQTDSLFPDLPYTADEGTGSVVADFDCNRTMDVFISKYEQSLFLTGTETGQFMDATSERLPQDASTISTWADRGDVDGDGDPDLVISNMLQRNNVYINHSSPDTIPPDVLSVMRPAGIVEPGIGQEVRVHSWDDALSISSVEISYRVEGGDSGKVSCRYAGGSLYIGEIPGQPPENTVRYYMTASDERGNHAHDPGTAPDSTYSYTTGEGTGIEDYLNIAEKKNDPPLLQNYPNP
ncbi:MAG: FG-GAP repeat domain-containing protein, partial [Candidatus Glassbacteria bacterium]